MTGPETRRRRLSRCIVPTVGMLALALVSCGHAPSPTPTPQAAAAPKRLPNILFLVMDDVGVDQMKLYGFGGKAPPQLPNIEAIASKGVVFSNAWAMPDCSPSRAAFFTGRLPARTNVLNPIQPSDLANSQVSPHAMTLPKILKQKGYVNALIGKMHLSGNEQNPPTNPMHFEVYRRLGFDYFNGYLDAAPLSVDTTAGGVAPPKTYACGFVPSKADDPANGADDGACYLPSGECSELSLATIGQAPGRVCLEKGGILDPSQKCQSSLPEKLKFGAHNGYYTANWIENLEDGVTTHVVPPGKVVPNPGHYRGYRSILEADRAIEWIKGRQNSAQPWMVTVGFSSAHTPWHNVPESILPAGSEKTGAYRCTGKAADPAVNRELRVLQRQMEEGLDHELGRILVETGIASRKADGSLDYDPAASNTMIVIVGDNGTFTAVVNEPFDPTRAKGVPYQTGVWVPLVAAGSMVASPGRSVNAMVNAVDLFQLFGEMAGADVKAMVPPAQALDSRSMLPYLTNAAQPAIRETDITQTGENARIEGPTTCVLPSMNGCTLFFPLQAICEKNGGIWYGPGSSVAHVPAEGLADCCAVNAFRASEGQAPYIIDMQLKTAIRDEQYKLVELVVPDCGKKGSEQIIEEFYAIDNARPVPLIDRVGANLLAGKTPADLTPEQKQHHDRLRQELHAWSDTVVRSCPGDGNEDLVVDEKDLAGFEQFAKETGGMSSWYDFNRDGKTDARDREIVVANQGRRCVPGKH